MKKNLSVLGAMVLSFGVWSCNDSSSGSGTANDSATMSNSSTSNNSGTAGSDTMTGTGTGSNGTPTVNTTPLSKADSTFVMEAAIGGMMEVQSGQLAQSNAANQRVKDFGAMMVRDHSQANNELKSFAAGRGITLPTALPADMQKHIDQMQKMTGRAFDMHYVNMMVNDHVKTVSKFQKESTSGGDADLKNWAGKTLPVLKMHTDSAQALKKMKM